MPQPRQRSDYIWKGFGYWETEEYNNNATEQWTHHGDVQEPED